MPNYHATSEGPVQFTKQEEIERQEQEKAHEAAKFPNAAASVRQKRDLLIAKTDWTQAADIAQTIKDSWAPYRKALRDVPQQAGFPFDVIWPT